MSIACIVILHFAWRVALLERPELDCAPLVLGPAPGGLPVVLDATPEATEHGVRPGLGLREPGGHKRSSRRWGTGCRR